MIIKSWKTRTAITQLSGNFYICTNKSNKINMSLSHYSSYKLFDLIQLSNDKTWLIFKMFPKKQWKEGRTFRGYTEILHKCDTRKQRKCTCPRSGGDHTGRVIAVQLPQVMDFKFKSSFPRYFLTILPKVREAVLYSCIGLFLYVYILYTFFRSPESTWCCWVLEIPKEMKNTC